MLLIWKSCRPHSLRRFIGIYLLLLYDEYLLVAGSLVLPTDSPPSHCIHLLLIDAVQPRWCRLVSSCSELVSRCWGRLTQHLLIDWCSFWSCFTLLVHQLTSRCWGRLTLHLLIEWCSFWSCFTLLVHQLTSRCWGSRLKCHHGWWSCFLAAAWLFHCAVDLLELFDCGGHRWISLYC